jgi:S1-C subfamily serine protease
MTPRESTGRITKQQWQWAISCTVAFWTCLFGLAILALAEAPNLPYNSVCDITAAPYGGSGTLVAINGDIGTVITCSHTFHGVGTSNVVCQFRDGYRCRAKFLGMDDAKDLSAFAIRVRPGMEVPTGIRAAKPGETLHAVGFPWYGQGALHYTTGQFVRYDNDGRVFFLAAPHVHSGFSGGALFSDSGEFCGVISGYDGEGVSIAGSGEPLMRFVSKWVEVK